MELLRGIYEAHLPVSDLDRAVEFYGERLGLERGLLQEERRVAFFFVRHGGKRSMLGLWETDEDLSAFPAVEYVPKRHFAFRVAVEDADRMVPWLRERGIEPVYPAAASLEGPVEEPFVLTWMPAAAVFFEDPDGNLLELLADLPGPPERQNRVVPLSEWRALAGGEE